MSNLYMSQQFTARLRVMTDSNRNDLQLMIDALPALLRDPVSTWFERLGERYPDLEFPTGSLAMLVRAVAVSEGR